MSTRIPTTMRQAMGEGEHKRAVMKEARRIEAINRVAEMRAADEKRASAIAKRASTATKPARSRLTDYIAVRLTDAERAHAMSKGGSAWVRGLIAKSLAREVKP